MHYGLLAKVFFYVSELACVAGAWKWWAQEKTGARERDTRGDREFPHPSRVSLARARSLFYPPLPSACYAGYQRICIFPTYEKFVSILKEACNRSNFGWLIRQMSMNQKRGRRFVEGLCWALFSFRLSHRNVIYRAKRK